MIEMCKQLILSILFIHLHVKFTAFILYEDCLNEIDCLTAHLSEYLEPIHFSKGTLLNIGEKYQGSENWDNWYFCTVDNVLEGWVPTQIIEWINKHQGYAIADYTAKELNVDHGDLLLGEEQLNGWIWCSRLSDDQSGWVPLEVLSQI